jgi:transcriptional regulator with XRE-family HTH domain
VIVQCHLRGFRGDRTLQELAGRAGVSKGQLSQIEQGRSLPRDRDVPLLERAYGQPRSEWYPADVAGVIEDEALHQRALVSEVWMPRSGKLRTYWLIVERLTGWDRVQLWSKGHHAPEIFVGAAEEYRRLEWPTPGATYKPLSAERVQHDWWATRQGWALTGPGGEFTFLYQPVEATANGAYPVTVIDL